MVLPRLSRAPAPSRGAVEEHRRRSAAAVRAVLCRRGQADMPALRHAPSGQGDLGDEKKSEGDSARVGGGCAEGAKGTDPLALRATSASSAPSLFLAILS